jgi:ABC-type Mn2+/Zn2+ transport system ATPase subunit
VEESVLSVSEHSAVSEGMQRNVGQGIQMPTKVRIGYIPNRIRSITATPITSATFVLVSRTGSLRIDVRYIQNHSKAFAAPLTKENTEVYAIRFLIKLWCQEP